MTEEELEGSMKRKDINRILLIVIFQAISIASFSQCDKIFIVTELSHKLYKDYGCCNFGFLNRDLKYISLNSRPTNPCLELDRNQLVEESFVYFEIKFDKKTFRIPIKYYSYNGELIFIRLYKSKRKYWYNVEIDNIFIGGQIIPEEDKKIKHARRDQ